MNNWNNIDFVQQQVKDWADQLFPQRTAHSALVKLMLEEIPEFALNQSDPGEYADLLILIFDIASLNNIDVAEALRDKMALNKRRNWHFDPDTGLAHHTSDDGALPVIPVPLLMCPHGEDPSDCQACYRDADFQYDRMREDRLFGNK